MKRTTRFLFALPALALAGCIEGYEPASYDGFPYANERTAGSGIAYVRARMIPEKGPSLDPMMVPDKVVVPEPESVTEPVVVEPEPVPEEVMKEAEQIFREMQKK